MRLTRALTGHDAKVFARAPQIGAVRAFGSFEWAEQVQPVSDPALAADIVGRVLGARAMP